MTWEGDGGEEGPLVEFLISTMDNPGAFPPECHIHHQERLQWFETSDQLPRYRVWHDGEDEPYSYEPALVGDEVDDEEGGYATPEEMAGREA